MRHVICCIIIETHLVDFDQPQTCDYEQRNERSWEMISIADNERKENCKVEKAFQNNQIVELFTNNEISM